MDENSFFENICGLSDKEIAKKYQFLGEGISRKVYSINDDYVVKVAKVDDGRYQNRVENYVFNNAPKNMIKYLCPIVWFEPDRIIMRKAIPLSNIIKDKFINLKKIRPEIESYSDLNTLTNNFILFAEDIISTSSWGILNNKNVLIDYGCTSHLGDAFYTFFYNW